jgi:hypothetical protein
MEYWVGADGLVYPHVPGSTTLGAALSPPTGVVYVDARPCILHASNGAMYILGCYSRPCVVTPYNTFRAVGITGPTVAPTIAANTSATGISGTALGYVTIRDKVGGVTLAESNPSKVSGAAVLDDDGRTWTTITTFAPDRGTHLAGYVSMDGLLPREVWERAIGHAGTVKEAVATDLLTSLKALPVDADGNLDVLARGVPPYAIVGCFWKDRLWYVDPSKAGVYFSRTGEYESVRVDNFLPCSGGHYPNGIAVRGDDELVLFHARGFYSITGSGVNNDFTIRERSADFGLVSTFGVVNIGGRLVYPSHLGVAVYDGTAPRNLMSDTMRQAWIDDYSANRAAFENSIAIDDHAGRYRLLTSRSSTPRSIFYIGDYRDYLEKQMPEFDWTYDKLDRALSTIAVVPAPNSLGYAYIEASCDGYGRGEDPTNADDDGDTRLKVLDIQHFHYLGNDQSGPDNESKRFDAMTLYLRNPNTTVTVQCYDGDETAAESSGPSADCTVASTESHNPSLVDKTSHHKVGEDVGGAGKGRTVRIKALSPRNVSYRGYSLYWQPEGDSDRLGS